MVVGKVNNAKTSVLRSTHVRFSNLWHLPNTPSNTSTMAKRKRDALPCNCTSCNGALKDPRTRKSHQEKGARRVVGDSKRRECRCPLHPNGEMVHRHTFYLHQRQQHDTVATITESYRSRSAAQGKLYCFINGRCGGETLWLLTLKETNDAAHLDLSSSSLPPPPTPSSIRDDGLSDDIHSDGFEYDNSRLDLDGVDGGVDENWVYDNNFGVAEVDEACQDPVHPLYSSSDIDSTSSVEEEQEEVLSGDDTSSDGSGNVFDSSKEEDLLEMPTGLSIFESLMFIAVYILILLHLALSFWLDWVDVLDGSSRKNSKKYVAFLKRHTDMKSPPSIYRINTELEKHTGMKPVWYDCCLNSCMAFTGEFSSLLSCTSIKGGDLCGEARYHVDLDRKGLCRPRKRFLYLPLGPRLNNLYMTNLAEKLCTYRAGFTDGNRVNMADIFDGDLYQNYHLTELKLFKRCVFSTSKCLNIANF